MLNAEVFRIYLPMRKEGKKKKDMDTSKTFPKNSKKLSEK